MLRTVVKNFSILSVGEVGSKVFTFAAMVYLVRILGVEGFGKISFAQAFVSYFVLLVIFGFDTIGVREISKNNSGASKYMNNITTLRFIISVVGYLLLCGIISWVNKPVDTKMVVLSYGLILFPTVFSLDWYFQGFERMNFIAILKLLRSSFLVFLLFLFVRTSKDTILAALMEVGSAMVVVFISFYYLKKNFHSFSFEIDCSFCKQLIKESLPVALISFMVTIYYNLDILMLGVFKDDTVVGLYSAAYRIILLGIIPITLWLYAFTPLLCKQQLDYRTLLNFIGFNLLIGIIVSFTIFITAKYTIKFLYGEKFSDAVNVLQILSIVPFMAAMAGSFANPLTLWGFQFKHLLAVSAGACTNFLLNILFIPKYGMVGAAAATIAAELSVAMVGSYIILFSLRKRKEL